MHRCRCGVALPYAAMRHCSRQCLDEAIDAAMVAALVPPPKRPVFRTKNVRWCGWCGETLPRGKQSFCTPECCMAYHGLEVVRFGQNRRKGQRV